MCVFPHCGAITVREQLSSCFCPLSVSTVARCSDRGTEGREYLGSSIMEGIHCEKKHWSALVKGFPKSNYVIGPPVEWKTSDEG